MAGSRDSFLCGAGRRFSVIRVPRGSEIVMLDGRRTRAADSERSRLSVQSGSLSLFSRRLWLSVFVAAAVETGSGGLIDSLQGFPIESRSQSSGFLCLHCAERFSSCHFLRASASLRVCSPSWSQVRLLPTWVSPAAVWHLEDFLWSVQSANYGRWVKLQLLFDENGLASALYSFGFDLLVRQKVKQWGHCVEMVDDWRR